MIKNKSAARMTLFSTLLMSSAMLVLYMMLITDINADAARRGVDFEYGYFTAGPVILLVITALLAFFISSVIIDRILNPIRLMISKVKDIGDMHFEKPLVINTEDDELREYVTAFNSMSQKLSSYIERQKRFISDASHELATPITIINGHADLLLRRGTEQPELLSGGLGIIKAEALRMDGLIDSLLLLARSDSGKQSYDFKQENLSALIDESVSEISIIAPDYEIETEIEDGLTAKCDGLAIRRVMRILFSNAVKYSGEGRSLRIKAHESHGLAHISIKDNGIGIPSEHLARIFDRFYRVDDSRSKKTGSSGLGLAIAKEIINAHGGEIEVISEPEAGAEFFIKLSCN
ncbi:MAG: HAMP domain-containing histidine kinase [Defluviitaleaceae bacterium]|nr:HAMP domain-containing histidine kinase [Defluviitaleaceae bacterium]